MRQSSRVPGIPGLIDQRLMQAYQLALRYMRRPYVTGIGIGRARRGGDLAETAVCIFVTEKIPAALLPPRSRFPKTIGGVPVDVVVCQLRAHQQTGPGAAAVNAGSTVRPGMMVGDGQHYGTLGMIARSASGHALYAMTCAHVLPGSSGSAAYQPADASPQNRCGRRGPVLWNLDGDVALIELSRPGDNVLGNSGMSLSAPRLAADSDILRKIGYVSGAVNGRVSHVGVKTVIYGDHAPVNVTGFYIETVVPGKEISLPGDSGAVWYDAQTGAAVGMEVAGDPGDVSHSGKFAFACYLSTAFLRLGLTMP